MAQDADNGAMGYFDSSSMDRQGPWRLVAIIVAVVLVAGIVYILAQPPAAPARSTASTSASASTAATSTVEAINGTSSTIHETTVGPTSPTVIGPSSPTVIGPSSPTTIGPSSPTTIGPSTPTTIGLNINDYELPSGVKLVSLASKSDALYGVPNPTSYTTTLKEDSASEDLTAGVLFNYTAAYGLNFTNAIPYIFDTFAVTVPAAYSNATYPLAVQVTVTNFTSAATAQQQYSSLSGGDTTFYLYPNNTRSATLAPGATSYRSITMVPQQVAFGNGTTTMLTVSPDYQNLEQQRLLIRNGSYMVYISAYGNLGKLNSTYVIDIAQNMYGQLS